MTEAALRRTILQGLLIGLYQGPDTKHSYYFHDHRLTPIEPYHPCNSFAGPINVIKLTFWDRLGIAALRTLYPWKEMIDSYRPLHFMDYWCFWKARTEREQRELVLAARHEREWRCHECKRRMDLQIYRPSKPVRRRNTQ